MMKAKKPINFFFNAEMTAPTGGKISNETYYDRPDAEPFEILGLDPKRPQDNNEGNTTTGFGFPRWRDRTARYHVS